MSKYLGKELVNKPKEWSWSSENGTVYTYEHVGTPDEIKKLIENYKKAGSDIKSVTEGSPLWKLQVESSYVSGSTSGGSSNDAGTPTWELRFNTVNKPLDQFKTYKAASYYNRTVIQVWKIMYDRGEIDVPTVAEAIAKSGIEASLVDNDVVQKYIDHRLKGTDSFDAVIPVIRLTLSQAKESSAKAALDGCGKIVSASSIGLPSGVIAKFAMPTQADGTAYEWLKKYPEITKQRTRYNISQEWEGYELASKEIYGGKDEP